MNECLKDKSYSKVLLKKHFEENSFIEPDIVSFNNFVDSELQKIINENKILKIIDFQNSVDQFEPCFRDNI